MQGGKGMKSNFISYPKYRDNYLQAFWRMLKAREAAGLRKTYENETLNDTETEKE